MCHVHYKLCIYHWFKFSINLQLTLHFPNRLSESISSELRLPVGSRSTCTTTTYFRIIKSCQTAQIYNWSIIIYWMIIILRVRRNKFNWKYFCDWVCDNKAQFLPCPLTGRLYHCKVCACHPDSLMYPILKNNFLICKIRRQGPESRSSRASKRADIKYGQESFVT